MLIPKSRDEILLLKIQKLKKIVEDAGITVTATGPNNRRLKKDYIDAIMTFTIPKKKSKKVYALFSSHRQSVVGIFITLEKLRTFAKEYVKEDEKLVLNEDIIAYKIILNEGCEIGTDTKGLIKI